MQSPVDTAAAAPDSTPCYECGVCWTVYDPAVGDDYGQVPPGTPFEALSSSWACPNCDAPKARFLLVPA
jgi:rubredoxin